LRPELSLPKLMRRWDQHGTAFAKVRGTAGNVRRLVDRARHGLTAPDAAAVGDDIATGAADLLTAISAIAQAQDRARWQAAADNATASQDRPRRRRRRCWVVSFEGWRSG
jgi:hypothetical protein